jgi:AcrR family transcriptional regulator
VPSPARTSTEQIVQAARSLLESDGLETVTMQRVAAVVGVRAPSLYKRIRDRADLMHRVANDAARELGDTLAAAATTGDPRANLVAIAFAFRQWAHGAPSAYALLTSPMAESWRVDPELNAQMSRAILAATEELVGRDDALEAARTFVAFAHGFVSLELAGTFRLGGDPADAYRFGVSSLVDAIAGRSRKPIDTG